MSKPTNTYILTPVKRRALNQFARALTLETHVLVRRPNSLWSQLYNRLQWDDDDITSLLAAAIQRQAQVKGCAWLRARRPYEESTELVMTLQAHTGGVTDCAFSPNDQFIVSSSNDKTLRVWDSNSGRELTSLTINDDAILFSISPDGKRLAFVEDLKIKVWEISSARVTTSLIGHTDSLSACVWRADGQQILSSGNEKTLRLWDSYTGEQVRQFGVRHAPRFCSISEDGARVVSQIFSDVLQIWDVASGQEIITIDQIGTINGWTLRSDSRLVLATSEWILEYDTQTARKISACRVKIETDYGRTAFVSPDGNRVVYLREGKIREVSTARVIAQLQPVKEGYCIFTPNGDRFATYNNSDVLLFDTNTGKKLGALQAHSQSVTCLAVNSNGSKVVSGSEDQTLKVWSTDVTRRRQRRSAHEGKVVVCVFSRDGGKVATFGGRGDLKIWNAESGELLTTINGEHQFNYEHTLKFSPDGSSLLGVTNRNSMAIWDATTGEERIRFEKQDGPVVACAFTPSGEEVISAGDNVLRISESATGQLITTLKGHREWTAVFCQTSDGRWLISASADKTALVWDLKTRKPARRLEGHTDKISTSTLSPDERLIATASNDGSVRIWEFDSGQEVQTLRGHEGPVTSASFTPDGKRIVSQGIDLTIRVWDALTGQQIANFVGAIGYSGFVVSPDGHQLAALKRSTREDSDVLDMPLVVWDIETENEITSITLPNPVLCSCYHPFNNRLVCGDLKGDVHLIDIEGQLN